MTLPQKLEDAAPVTTIAEARERVADLLGPAHSRALWFMMLDRYGSQLPVVVPIDGIPLYPEPEQLGSMASKFCSFVHEHGPDGSVILTLERPGPAALTAPDQAWGAALQTAFGGVTRVMAMFLVYDDGIAVLEG